MDYDLLINFYGPLLIARCDTPARRAAGYAAWLALAALAHRFQHAAQ